MKTQNRAQFVPPTAPTTPPQTPPPETDGYTLEALQGEAGALVSDMLADLHNPNAERDGTDTRMQVRVLDDGHIVMVARVVPSPSGTGKSIHVINSGGWKDATQFGCSTLRGFPLKLNFGMTTPTNDKLLADPVLSGAAGRAAGLLAETAAMEAEERAAVAAVRAKFRKK